MASNTSGSASSGPCPTSRSAHAGTPQAAGAASRPVAQADFSAPDDPGLTSESSDEPARGREGRYASKLAASVLRATANYQPLVLQQDGWMQFHRLVCRMRFMHSRIARFKHFAVYPLDTFSVMESQEQHRRPRSPLRVLRVWERHLRSPRG